MIIGKTLIQFLKAYCLVWRKQQNYGSTYNFMNDHICQWLVTSHNARGDKCQTWVFHSTKREGRWHDEEVIAFPLIRTEQLLPCRQKLLHFSIKLSLCSLLKIMKQRFIKTNNILLNTEAFYIVKSNVHRTCAPLGSFGKFKINI